MSLINFESLTEIKKKKGEERQLRQNILEKAKYKYEREKQKQKQAEERGETVWMLPKLEKKLHAQNENFKPNIADDSNDIDNQLCLRDEENSVQDSGHPPNRQEWMELTSLFKTREQIQIADGSSRALLRLQERKRKEEADKPGSNARELNPYYKSGGLGLPPESSEQEQKTPKPPGSNYEAQWLRKALLRAKEQAKEEGRTLEDVARDRWGSLETFYKLLHAAEGNTRDEEQTGREGKKMARKDDSNKANSRKKLSSSRHKAERSRSRDRDKSRSKSRRYKEVDREITRSRDRERSRSRDRERSRSRDRERSRSWNRARSRSRDRTRSRSRDRTRSRDRERSKTNNSRYKEDRDRKSKSKDSASSKTKSSRQNERERSKDRSRSRSKSSRYKEDREGRSGSRDREESRSKSSKYKEDNERRSRSRDQVESRTKSSRYKKEHSKSSDEETSRSTDKVQSKRNYEYSNKRSRSKERKNKRHRRRKHSSSSTSGDSSSTSESSNSSTSSSTSNSSRERSRRKKYENIEIEDRSRDSSFRQKGLKSSEKTSQKLSMLKPGSDSESPPRNLFTRSSDFSHLRSLDAVQQSSKRSNWKKKSCQRSPVTEVKNSEPLEHSKHLEHSKRLEHSTTDVDSSISTASATGSLKEGANDAIGKKDNLKSVTEPAVALTNAQMNQLAAKLTKAELMGNEALVKKLKKKLLKARLAKAEKEEAKEVPSDSRDDDAIEEEVILTRTNNSGFTRPVEGYSGKSSSHKRSKAEMVDAEGKRTAYFPNDFDLDLNDLFVKEKSTSAADQIAALEGLAASNAEKLSDDFDVDDMYIKKVAQKKTSRKEMERDRQKAILEHRRSEKILDSCPYCVGNKLMKKHLIVALGTKCYLSVPYHQSLTEGHCLIAPIHHVPCGTLADEDLWEEIMCFRKALVRMFSKNDEDCVFFESALKLHKPPHMVLHCVPLPRETGDLAPIYFKKAIQECDEEWAQNKKLIELNGRSVRRAVPKGLPYFSIDFGMTPGFAHVVENENLFPHNFGQEIIGGMIDADISLFRKPKAESFDVQRKKVIAFAENFKLYDPTS